MRKAIYLLLLLAICGDTAAQKKKPVANAGSQPPALSAIKEADLKKDLYAMAADHFRGREAGTLDELKVSMWWADELRKAGLEPAGDDGTYFQYFNLYRNRISSSSTITINNTPLQLWRDVLVTQTAPARLSLPVVFVGKGSVRELDRQDLRGKAVAIQASSEGINLNVSLPERRYMGYVLNRFRTELTNRGVAAIIFIADEMAERSWAQMLPAAQRGLYDIEGGPNATVTERAPVLWLRSNAMALVQNEPLLNVQIAVESFLYPSVNIIAKVPGADKALKAEYVLFSGHQDHDGVRLPYGQDSIYNGADDNATVSVAIMAIARAFKKSPGRRSALFVWHGAEERGLLGSRWYSAHPTVAANSIVAVLNGDMIGRNHPDSAALLGSQMPHRNSTALVQMAMDANKEGPKFKLDTLWDKPAHVEGWYFRSDHLPYARAGFPALFYTTLLHPDYHTPMDDAEHIDYRKLKRMTEWMYRTGWKVANAADRPRVDEGFKLER
jgi:hypothetical protein